MEKIQSFESWGIVELFGHNRVAGRITEQTIGGCSFVRVDIPETKDGQAFTRMFGNGAIYSINITDEETAKLAAEMYTTQPITKFEIQREMRKRLPDATEDASSDDDDLPW